MIQLELKRVAKKPTYTIGKLYIDGKYFCDTLEDKDRGLTQSMTLEQIKKLKVYGETAIPTGTYKINMHTISQKFKNSSWAKEFGGVVPRLEGVPGYEGVLLHPGNSAEQSLGCILVGKNKVVGKVLESQIIWKALMKRLQNDDNIIIKIS